MTEKTTVPGYRFALYNRVSGKQVDTSNKPWRPILAKGHEMLKNGELGIVKLIESSPHYRRDFFERLIERNQVRRVQERQIAFSATPSREYQADEIWPGIYSPRVKAQSRPLGTRQARATLREPKNALLIALLFHYEEVTSDSAQFACWFLKCLNDPHSDLYAHITAVNQQLANSPPPERWLRDWFRKDKALFKRAAQIIESRQL